MASITGHFVWILYMRHIVAQAAAGMTSPVFAAGPEAVTVALKVSLLVF